MTWDQIRTRFYNLTKTNSSSMNAANLNSYTQPSTERVIALINRSDAKWEFDDSNYGDLPIATTQLNSGQQDYSLSTSHLTIDRIEVKDATGNWHLLTPINQHQISQEALAAHLATNGTPSEYDVRGTSVFLYPAPNYTLASALKLYFTRGPLQFDYSTSQFTDGSGSISSTPGFNSLFHDLIPLTAAYDYCVVNLPELAGGYLAAVQRYDQALDQFYGNRFRAEPRRMTVATNRTIGNASGTISAGSNDSNR